MKLITDRRAEYLPRYEGALGRSLYRTMHELQRLQLSRLGAQATAPVAVDVEVDLHAGT